jgi:glutaconate CoA-transferase subunit A
MNRVRPVASKVMSAEEAVRTFVWEGMRLRSGGIAVRKPMCLLNEVVRQRKRGITLLLSGFTEDADLLVGAGCVPTLEGSYFGLEALGLAPNYRRAVEQGIPQRIVIEEYSNFGMTMRFMAAAMGLPFMPIKSHLGSDLVTHRSLLEKKCHVMEDPFTGETVMLLPACRADVAFIHAQRCDEAGNLQVWGQIGDDEWGSRAATHIVAEVEEVVDEDVVRRDPNRTIIPGFRVDAIVIAPYGAHPYQCQGYYDLDLEFRMMYARMAQTREGFLQYLDEWIYGTANHDEYLKKLGFERLQRLKAKAYWCYPVNYGY